MLHVPQLSSDRTFSDALRLELCQFWRSELEPGFQPGEVRVGWTPEKLSVQAVLQDRDSYNSVVDFNQPAFLSGDVFEIFLQPPEAEEYYEFHVGPANQLYQLRIPSLECFTKVRKTGIPPEWLIHTETIESSVIQQEDFWTITANIPAALLGISSFAQDQQWKLSFCRYDANRNPDSCILSSTSPFTKVDFHRLDEWKKFLFV